jgi:hypothetical protein
MARTTKSTTTGTTKRTATKKATNVDLGAPAASADDRAAGVSAAAAPVSSAAIAERAFALYCERGGAHGFDLEDWLRAERELAGQRL